MSIIDVDYFPTYFYFLLWDNLSRGWLWRGIIDIKVYISVIIKHIKLKKTSKYLYKYSFLLDNKYKKV